jgi:hypothetical protein
MKQRIALVAVTALTAGFLSVATSPVANAVAGGAAGDIKVTVDQDLTVAGGAATGVCSVANSAGTFQTLDNTSRDYTSTSAAPLTITMALGGILRFKPYSGADASAQVNFFTYTANGTLRDDTDVAASKILSSNSGLWQGSSSRSTDDTATLTAIGVGTNTIRVYATAPFAGPNTANAALASPSGTMTVVVVASCASISVGSTSFSANRADAIPVAAANIADVTLTYGDTTTFAAGSDGYISIVGKTATNQILPSTTTWIASATNSAKVTLATSSATSAGLDAAGTLSVVSTTAAGTSVYVRVTPNNKALGGTTTVTVSADGVELVNKTLTFLPEAAKMVVIKNMRGTAGGEGAFSYQLQSATGTVVPGSVSVRTLTLTPQVTNATQAKAATIAAAASAGTTNAVNNTSFFSSTTANGIVTFTCATAASSTSKVTFRHTNAVSAVAIDTVVDLTCAGSVATYTISTDKAAYKVGEIATITIDAKDSSGVAVSDFATIGGAGTTTISIGGGTITKAQVDGALGTGDLFTAGLRTYQAQMTTAGTFNTVVNLPGSTTKTATTGYSVSTATSEVSNAQVLQSIVALIASINKQIQALQALILKKK